MYEFETRAVRGGNLQTDKPENFPAICLIKNEENCDNNTINSLEKSIASLENAKYALCFPSGTATVTSIVQILEEGDHVILFDSVYHGTRTYIKICEEIGILQVNFVDLRDADVLRQYLKPNTKMVWIETPCNPTMKIVDIQAIANILRENGNAFLVVDNTFMSPYFQNPLKFGADISMHSLTKFMNGHSDCLMGALAINDDTLYAKLRDARNAIGNLPSPLECYLVHRGLKTLHIRMEKHAENAMAIAKFLETHPKVEKVNYPGLKSHPQYELAKKQCRGYSGMLSFCMKGGTAEVEAFVQNLKIFTLAVSLGSIESLIEISSLMTARVLSKEQREKLEIPDNLLRISVGLECSKDLINDLKQAFEKV